MTLREYIDRLRGRTVAVIGIGVSNTPLLRLLLREQSQDVSAMSADILRQNIMMSLQTKYRKLLRASVLLC